MIRSPKCSRPASSAGLTALTSMPSSRAARRTSAGSPIGSTAATRSSRRTSGGQRREPAPVAVLDPARQPLRAQLGRRRLPVRRSSSPAAAPATPAGCRGSPPGCGRAPARPAVHGIDAASSSRAASGGRPPIASCRRPAKNSSSAGSRTANTSPTASAPSRRATNPRVCADARSSHCASSITQTTGLLGRGLGQQTEDGQAQQEALRRGACPQTERHAQRVTLRPRDAVETVQQWGAQLMQACEGELGVRLHTDRPDHPAAGTPASIRYSSSADLPIPASPGSTRARLVPLCTSSTRRSSSRHSERRSISMP